MSTANNSLIRQLSQQIHALTDDAQIQQWAQFIYDNSPDAPVPIPVPEPLPTPVTSLTLYEHDNFGGRSMAVNGTVANFEKVFNDLASSAVVVGPWEVFSDAYYSGRRITLQPGSYSSLRALNMNDAISSCRPFIPPIAVARERKEYFYFTATATDWSEVWNHVTAMWDHCWGDPQDTTARLLETRISSIGEFAQHTFFGNEYRVDAELRLRMMFDLYQQDDVLKYLKRLYIDEPTMPYSTMARAVESVRKVASNYRDLSDLRMMVCFGDEGRGAENYYCADLFDDIATDAYGERATIADSGGRLDRLISRIRPNQRVFAVPGTNTGVGALSPDEFRRVVQYVLDTPQCGGMMPFTWFDQVKEGNRGARSNELRESCIAAGKNFIEWNASL